MLLRLCGITGFCALPKMLEERPGDTFLFASSHFRWKTPIDEESQVESYIPLPFVYLWTSVTPQQMKMRQRVRKALCSNETLSRYSVERQNEDGGGVESGFGGGERAGTGGNRRGGSPGSWSTLGGVGFGAPTAAKSRGC